MTADTFVSLDQNGGELLVASGGVITVNSGGAINAASGTLNVGGVTLNPFAPKANTAISTVGAGTLTAAALVGGLITRSGSTTAFTDTTDTAANLIAAIPNPVIGTSWELSIINTTAVAETLAAGSGVTLAGLAGPLPGNATGRFQCTYTGTGAVTIQCLSITYNAAGGYDPSTVQTQFGSSTGTFLEEGNLNRQIASPAINPGATGADNVLAVYSIPANAFDSSGRGLSFTAMGSFATNAHTKECKIIFNPSSAVVGSTVGTGGTTIADTGASTASNVGWCLQGQVFKYGATGSNTQYGQETATIIGATHGGIGLPLAITATENAAILVAVTGNATTTATDIGLSFFETNAMN